MIFTKTNQWRIILKASRDLKQYSKIIPNCGVAIGFCFNFFFCGGGEGEQGKIMLRKEVVHLPVNLPMPTTKLSQFKSDRSIQVSSLECLTLLLQETWSLDTCTCTQYQF